ncbi:preprotein translocase subunit SecG [Candidatus Falkowbacteria bacterium]|nr:preprotein translocase subunit SecG [Candidatus Falkowbacteria bacterium]
MKNIILIAEVVIAILLMVSILLQGRGAGLSGVFGGSSAVYRTKRGIEKFLTIFSVVLFIIFVGLAITSLILY